MERNLVETDVKSSLIDLVHAEPMIWNMFSEAYKVKAKEKDMRWKAIAFELKIDVKAAKSTWKNLRTIYSRELKKCLPQASGSGADDHGPDLYTGTWPHFEKLRFLSDTVRPRETSGNLDGWRNKDKETVMSAPKASCSLPLDVTRTVDEGEEGDDDFLEDLAVQDDSIPFQSPTPTNSATSSTESKKRRTTMQRALDLEEKKLKIFEQREKNRAGDDDDMLFLKSLHGYLKKADDKIGLRVAVMKTIKDFIDLEQLMHVQET